MATKRRPIGPHNDEAWQAHTLETLRKAVPDKDRLLVGDDEIARFLNELGFTVSSRTVESWRQRCGAPIRAGGRGYHRLQPITSTYALLAWLVCSKHARGLRGSGSMSRHVQAKEGRKRVTRSPAPDLADSAMAPEAA